ncbi:MAG TPA: hypothetical protein VFB74_33060 [Kribbellaceae bacterium]|nr:hypothetical protein [Kribbellaceae bacterium]
MRDRVTAAALTPFDAAVRVRTEAVADYAGALARSGAARSSVSR